MYVTTVLCLAYLIVDDKAASSNSKCGTIEAGWERVVGIFFSEGPVRLLVSTLRS